MKQVTDEMRDELRAAELPVWATIIPARARYGTLGAVKIHKRVNHARSAVTQFAGRDGYPEAEIYRLVNGEWKLEWRIEEGTPATDLPWKDTKAERLKELALSKKNAERALQSAKERADLAREQYEALRADGV